MTLDEYERASRLRRLGYRLYRNPLLMLLVDRVWCSCSSAASRSGA